MDGTTQYMYVDGAAHCITWMELPWFPPNTHTRTRTHAHIHAHSHAHARTRARTHARTHTRARTHALTHAHIHTHARTHTHNFLVVSVDVKHHVYLLIYTNVLMFMTEINRPRTDPVWIYCSLVATPPPPTPPDPRQPSPTPPHTHTLCRT